MRIVDSVGTRGESGESSGESTPSFSNIPVPVFAVATKWSPDRIEHSLDESDLYQALEVESIALLTVN
ncbi:hypothetical protein FRB95_009456 [Tulasnella sp. JGI-2019a]|nr:hypothetical protein FRB95_009456 [Tulasnella sp. JGI-2019a]